MKAIEERTLKTSDDIKDLSIIIVDKMIEEGIIKLKENDDSDIECDAQDIIRDTLSKILKIELDGYEKTNNTSRKLLINKHTKNINLFNLDLRFDIENGSLFNETLHFFGTIISDDENFAIDCDGLDRSYLYTSEFEYESDIKTLREFFN
jgi:hypothetical protein